MAKKLIQVVYKVEDKELIEAQKAIRGNEKAAKDADAAIRKYGEDAKKAGHDAARSFADLQNIFTGIGAVAVVGFFTNLTKKIIDLGIKQEQLNIAFTTFLGSAERAKKLMGELTKFSILTPFTPDQVNRAAKTLLAFGIQAEEIIPTLKMLGDVSSGTGKDLSEMAVIFGQIRSTGRLMGQDLLQLINAGFNPLQEISQKTGVSVRDLKEEMEKGNISFQMVADSFKRATSEGGLFFNLMEKQSKSLGGKFSTIEGNIEEIGKKLYEQNNGPLADFAEILMKISSNTEGVSNAINNFLTALASNPVIAPFIATLALLADSTEEVKDSYKGANTEQDNGFRAAIKLGFAVANLSEETKKLTKDTDKLTEAQKKQLDQINGRGKNGMSGSLEGYVIMSKILDKKIKDKVAEIGNGAPPAVQTIAGDPEKISDELDMVLDMSFKFLDDLFQASLHSKDELFKLEEFDMDRKLALAGDNERAKMELEVQKADFDKEQAKKKEEFDKAQDKKDRDRVIKKMTLDTFLTAIKAASDGPPYPNLPKAAIALAFGLAQVGLAKAIPFKDGVIDLQGPGTGTSDSISARLSKGESVMTADETARSYNLLTAIRENKIDDKVLDQLKISNSGIVVNLNDDRIVKAIQANRAPSLAREGYTIMETYSKGSNLKIKQRAKLGL
jgi:tape measure domain-containing protein